MTETKGDSVASALGQPFTPGTADASEWEALPDEVALASEDAWRTAEWEGLAAGSPDGELAPELATPDEAAPELAPPELAGPDEPGVRHEAGGG